IDALRGSTLPRRRRCTAGCSKPSGRRPPTTCTLEGVISPSPTPAACKRARRHAANTPAGRAARSVARLTALAPPRAALYVRAPDFGRRGTAPGRTRPVLLGSLPANAWPRCTHSARDLVLVDLLVQRASVNPKDLRCGGHVPIHVAERGRD